MFIRAIPDIPEDRFRKVCNPSIYLYSCCQFFILSNERDGIFLGFEVLRSLPLNFKSYQLLVVVTTLFL